MEIFKELENHLMQNPDFVSDTNELKKWIVMDKAYDCDESLILSLLENKVLKQHFFKKIGESLVFDQKKFMLFLEQKNYLNDSFTKYKNKIGLNIGGKYLNQRNEVALVWPFKDCILEGGQSKDDQKKNEILFNEILAQDEIYQLLEPKVITAGKRISSEGETDLVSFNRNSEGNITDNLLIKGNNLLALYTLLEQFKGQVKLIYIDPPYNTGNDSFGYNDRFNHASWLTFMKNRLEVAKQFLREDGVIFVSCDDNEFAYLKILMDDIFKRENFLNDIIWNSTKSVTNTALVSVSHTHNLVYFKNLPYFTKNRNEFRLKETGEGFSNPDFDPRGPWKADPFQVGGWRPKQQYEIINPHTGVIYRPNDGNSWKNEKKVFDELVKENRIVFGTNGDSGPYRKRFLTEALQSGKVAKTLWDDVGTTTSGTRHHLDLFSKIIFKNPKPETFLQRILELSTKENDIVLDFFLGSGTTVAVAHKMKRQYIGVEQMDYIDTVCKERLKKVINGEKGGISKSVDWKGGSSFVYFELKKYNQGFMEQIESATDTVTLLDIWESMKAHSFLNYNVDLKKQEETIEDFKGLALNEQKQVLCSLLDKNQLYVNLSSLDDSDYHCSESERQITLDFYKKEDR